MKNKKGFMSISIIYSFLILFLILMFSILISYSNRINMISSLVGETKNKLKEIPESIIIIYSYTGNVQEFIAPKTGTYMIELWGAQGGSNSGLEGSVAGNVGGLGGYTKGNINMNIDEKFYIYVGGTGQIATSVGLVSTKGYNGGGMAGYEINCGTSCMKGAGGGGGATDVRTLSGVWNDTNSLRTRIMVASGGGGSANWYWPKTGGAGGGIIGLPGQEYNAGTYSYTNSTGATQTTGGNPATGSSMYGSFGLGADSNNTYGGGGGSGYYGGGGGGVVSSCVGSGAGGSSFISGHNGCNAINSSGVHTGQPNHYSGKVFTNTIMIDGEGYNWTNVKGALVQMPNPQEGLYPLGIGHSGNGYARITYLGA